MKYIALDIGGTWIKGTVVNEHSFQNHESTNIKNLQVEKVKSQLDKNATIDRFVESILELIQRFNISVEEIAGIGISTAGIVNYEGTRIVKVAPHLDLLKNNSWKTKLEHLFGCNVSVINDADAASTALAQLGYLKGNKAIGVMPVGTGLGFAVWRNGRRWRPGKVLTLLGSIRYPNGDFNDLASASQLALCDKDCNLLNVFTDTDHAELRHHYLSNLVKVVNSAAILYNLDEVIICGGLSDAANSCNFPLEKQMNELLKAETPVELEKPVKVVVAKEGNRLQLIGALLLANGEAVAMENRYVAPYCSLNTEIPYQKNLQLHDMKCSDLIEAFWRAENEASEQLKYSLPVISEIANTAVERVKLGGRIIYIGCGTSGRIAAMDAVEIPCTYGFPEERIIALISGGNSDAAIEIESDFEEDASAVPEVLLLNVQPNDIVIGISASGSAYFVQSALAIAKNRGALSVMIQCDQPEKKPAFCDHVISLQSGYEVVAGSTRMKAGTATKKILNFLSSTIMIKVGKVTGPYMTDVACINKKLIERAQAILKTLYGIEEEEALRLLKNEDMNLNETIKSIQQNRKIT